MGRRGPVSRAELAVLPVALSRRMPRAPAHMPPEAAAIYVALAAAASEQLAPADPPMLEALAVAIARLRVLQAGVIAGDEVARREFVDLSKLAMALATKCRLSSSATRKPTAGRPADARGPVDIAKILGGRHAD